MSPNATRAPIADDGGRQHPEEATGARSGSVSGVRYNGTGGPGGTARPAGTRPVRRTAACGRGGGRSGEPTGRRTARVRSTSFSNSIGVVATHQRSARAIRDEPEPRERPHGMQYAGPSQPSSGTIGNNPNAGQGWISDAAPEKRAISVCVPQATQ